MSASSSSRPYLLIDDLQKLVVDTPDDSIISRTIHKDDAANVVLFAFAAGQALSEHTAASDAILHFLSGEATVTLGDETFDAHTGTWIRMQARLPHSVVAKTPVSMLLILLKGRT
jgi:quercetin dioxygenase-like cupin family protein